MIRNHSWGIHPIVTICLLLAVCAASWASAIAGHQEIELVVRQI
jgi:hypothetical protein